MAIYQCNGCERFCRAEIERCGDDSEVPDYCLFDGRQWHHRASGPRWYRVVEYVSYREVPDDYDPCAEFRRGP